MRFVAYTIFLSAFLLFQVQPMMARYILPWFGGSSSVWATCLLFFQAGLLIGYGYSHLLTKFLTAKNQVKVHASLLLLSIISIPIAPHFTQNLSANPVTSILILLTLSAGFPYIMISATGPLLQFWFSTVNPKKSPYRLYALSNLGSLIGLISYPFIIEPYLKLNTQTWFWSVGYLLFIVLCGMVAYSIWQFKPVNVKQKIEKEEKVSFIDKALWLLLSFMGVVALLSVTNKLTQDFVVVPFLWIAPLSLYLISFIIAFENNKWYNRKVFIPLMLILITFILARQIKFVVEDANLPVDSTILIYCLGVFFICMVLHGELSRLKPGKGNLTFFYFMNSLGGVLGGVFINFIVPVIFDGYWEIYFAFCGTVILIGYVLVRNSDIVKAKGTRIAFAVLTICFTGGMLITMKTEYDAFNEDVIVSYRNFYGVLKVSENNKGAENWQRTLIHGDILHGIQFMQPQLSKNALTYYGKESGVGLAMSTFPQWKAPGKEGMKAGLIGLGIGTISAYGNEKDTYRYFEINPVVETISRKYFKYLGEFKGKMDVVVGDGRISLDNELKTKGSTGYDIIVVDAFSGDNIPTHLVNREAMELYLNCLDKDGIIAFNITNAYLNLLPVMAGLSETFKLPCYYFYQPFDPSGPIDAIWILFTTNKKFLDQPSVTAKMQPVLNDVEAKIYWTDDYAPVFPLLQ